MIGDIKNTIPIFAILKYKTFKTSSKKFYFAKDFLSDEFLHQEKLEIITTLEFKEHGEELPNSKLPDHEIENELLNLLKFLELSPILVAVENLPEEFSQIPLNEVKEGEITNFLSEFIFDLKLVSNAPIQLKMAVDCQFYLFRAKFLPLEHYVIKIGAPERDESPLVRVHSSCYTGDLLASLRCDCRDQLQESIKFISKAEGFSGGYILYLMQEGRGIGLANKIKAYNFQQLEGLDTVESNLKLGFKDDERSFLPAIKMLEFFKVNSISLITNNPKKAQDMEKLGIKVEKTIHTIFAINEYNESYLKVKEEKMGHSFKN